MNMFKMHRTKSKIMTLLLMKSSFLCLYGSLKFKRAEYINTKPGDGRTDGWTARFWRRRRRKEEVDYWSSFPRWFTLEVCMLKQEAQLNWRRRSSRQASKQRAGEQRGEDRTAAFKVSKSYLLPRPGGRSWCPEPAEVRRTGWKRCPRFGWWTWFGCCWPWWWWSNRAGSWRSSWSCRCWDRAWAVAAKQSKCKRISITRTAKSICSEQRGQETERQKEESR